MNPKYEAVAGVLAYPDVGSLPVCPDLAVVCTPPATLPGIVRALRERGNRAVIVLTAGLDGASTDAESARPSLVQQMLDEARPATMRILGPNCVGLLAPRIGLNASFAQTDARPGHLAFVSQSGALCTVVLDWAIANGVGFSHFVSLGNACDVDFGDVIDHLGADPETHAILLYIESIKDGRKFLSAARAASRNKPIVAIKAGRVREGAEAARSHTGALGGSDDVMDYALRRAGILPSTASTNCSTPSRPWRGHRGRPATAC